MGTATEDVDILKNEQATREHEDYPDIMPRGIETYPFVRSRILPIFYEIKDGAKVLDVGCNSGEFMRLLKTKKGCDVYGVDVSKTVIDIAKSKGLNAVLTDGKTLPYPDNTFDVATLMETLEHIPDPIECLREIRRVLKPDGYLLGSCPHKNLERYIWADDRKHHQNYDEKGLEFDLKEVFKKVYIQVLNGTQLSMSFAQCHLRGQPVGMLFKAGGKKTQDWEQMCKESTNLRAWFGPTQGVGTVYYRMRGYADKLHKYGVEAAYEDFDYDGSESQMMWQNRIVYMKDGKVEWSSWLLDAFFGRLLDVAHMSIWQVVANRYALAFLKCIRDKFLKPVITEVDDWLLDLPAYNVASNPYNPNSEKEWVATEQMKSSDALIVSTQFMIDHLKEFFPDKPMYLIPNSIDFDIWDNLKPNYLPIYKKDPGVIRIGYTGCENHTGDLDMVKKPILKLLEEFPNLEICFAGRFSVGNTKLWADIKHPRVKFWDRWVLVDRYPNEVAGWKMDIGIAPLRDNNFNRAKSNLRWLEYSAMKLPTVASRVYPFKHSIENEKTGILCNSELEWYEALRSLIVDEGKRAVLGNQAYEKVKKDYNMDTIAGKYATVLKEIKWTGVNLKPKLQLTPLLK